jgi:carboxyl-terminal processing protease
VDGEIVEGVGVAPDIEVQRPVPYAGGADRVLDAAVEHLVRDARRRGTAKPDGNSTSQ